MTFRVYAKKRHRLATQFKFLSTIEAPTLALAIGAALRLRVPEGFKHHVRPVASK